MAHAEKCPVCDGKGKLNNTKVTHGSKTCHGCGGLGWITVGTEYPHCPVYPTYPEPWYPYPNWHYPTTTCRWVESDTGSKSEED